MSNVPRLNYFVENENAESATKNFAAILQKAFEQYRKLWDKYLDLVKKYEGDNSTHEQIQKTWNGKKILKSTRVLSENIDIFNFNKYEREMKSWEKEKKTCDWEENKNIIEDMFEECNLDCDSNIYDTICQSPTHKETKNIVLPESPIFMRKDEKLISTISKNEISTSNNNKNNSNVMEIDDILDFNKQKEDDSFSTSEKHVNNISFNSLSPAIICNTPIGNSQCYRKNKQRLLKKQITSKYKQKLKENTINHKKQRVNEKNIPLQALENFISPSKISLNRKGNKTDNDFMEYKQNKVSPESKKLKQTTLSFHAITNKVDNVNIVKPDEKSIPITKCKKFLFKCKSYTENISGQNEATDNKINDTMYIDNINNQNEAIYEDIIASSPNSISQNRNPLKLKRKLSNAGNTEVAELSESINEFDSAFTSLHTSPTKTQHQTSLTNKKNTILADNTVCFTSGIIVDNTNKKPLKLSTNIQLKEEFIKNNDYDEIASTDDQESSLLDVFQSMNEDETYFEDPIEEGNNISVNKELDVCHVNNISPIHKTLTDIHYKLENPRQNTAKGAEIKTKEGWSCWECNEYYKNRPDLSEKHLQKWKNQCSRHRNIYYAGQATPEGFWDPLFPPTASDSIQEI